MIARIWRGVVRTEDAAECVEYVRQTIERSSTVDRYGVDSGLVEGGDSSTDETLPTR